MYVALGCLYPTLSFRRPFLRYSVIGSLLYGFSSRLEQPTGKPLNFRHMSIRHSVWSSY